MVWERSVLGMFGKQIAETGLPDPLDFAFPVRNLRNIVHLCTGSDRFIEQRLVLVELAHIDDHTEPDARRLRFPMGRIGAVSSGRSGMLPFPGGRRRIWRQLDQRRGADAGKHRGSGHFQKSSSLIIHYCASFFDASSVGVM